ncbi:hypothetical protein BDZ89DRAFT_1150852 [Hymenopellis radicata]|nr:hypothetical protein BDZ89DRAFT_1150852 [Hymenopellis radicata]
MAKLLDNLTSIPHLQTLIRGLTIQQRGSGGTNDLIPIHWQQRGTSDDILLPAHMSCLASVLSLLPNPMKVAFPGWAVDDITTRSYLNLIPNVLGNAPLVELDVNVCSVETFRHVFGILGGTNIKRVSLFGVLNPYKVDPKPTRKRLHLPSLEGIRFGVDTLQAEFHNLLTHYFDLPNLKTCEIVIPFVDDLLEWQDVLRRGFPPLELFKVELECTEGFTNDVLAWIDDDDNFGQDAICPLPLAGLPFQHVHFSVSPRALQETRTYIEWLSSTFRALSDSKATMHFTELTFTFPDLQDIDTLGEAWNSLDDSLAHTTFSGVRNIHFERSRREGRFVTRVAYYPVLAENAACPASACKSRCSLFCLGYRCWEASERLRSLATRCSWNPKARAYRVAIELDVHTAQGGT